MLHELWLHIDNLCAKLPLTTHIAIENQDNGVYSVSLQISSHVNVGPNPNSHVFNQLNCVVGAIVTRFSMFWLLITHWRINIPT